ncbi:MAG: hypothetical protein OEZ39_07775 [Gammaproteobacteria bacterium]|nr:hypothetical protein [Gammaproteobacteria bacterium]MDH5651758.1 hypothetical protein [Gammaproteobacteria bacterium]
MKRFLFLVLAGLLPAVTVLHADYTDHWPAAAEQARAPAWPQVYSGNPSTCSKPDENPFYAYQDAAGLSEDTAYTIDAHIDLNLDGMCEIIAFRSTDCDDTGCRYTAFRITDKNKVLNIGTVDFGEYLTPVHGWLQMRTKSRDGEHYRFHLYRYVQGKYRIIRSDHYRYNATTKNTTYVKTVQD